MSYYLIASGEDSAFGIDAFLEGPATTSEAFAGLRREFRKMRFHETYPATPAFKSPDREVFEAKLRARKEREAAHYAALGISDGDEQGWVDFLVSRHGFKEVEYQEVHEGTL